MKFADIDISDSLEDFASKRSKTLLRRIDSFKDRYRFSLNVKPGARKKDGSVKVFSATGVIKMKSTKELRATCTSHSPRVAVGKVIERLERQVRRHTEKSERSRATLGRSLKSVRQFKIDITR